ncbi:YheC/YheD family endospore coat-associated protein [Paenibacillus glycinis]|uniref:ATP-grasp domain-containing protein n=1 Tax=Paenibacillus glycinis TaxID=2697035 RepID=A0ABW9XRC2_9BACL|nr:YheC/YheD family protein [Paenibacillus glycinis]NBD25198.1 hypothetical protein [Paenibacillus glycinis]
MEKRRFIAIMVPTRRARKPTLRFYQRCCDPNTAIYAFCPDDIIWSERRIIGLRRYKRSYRQRVFPFPLVVYNRCFNKKTETVQRLEDAIGPGKCFNVINFFNKWLLYNLLKPSEAGPYVPDTYLYDKEELPRLLETYKLVYIKPLYGSMGKFVYRVELQDDGEVHLALHSLSASLVCRDIEDMQRVLGKYLGTQKYLVQQGIRTTLLDRRHFDIRVLMQKNGSGEWAVSNMASRVAYRQYFNTAICETIRDAADVLPRIFEPDEREGILRALTDISIVASAEAEANMGLLGELSVDYVVDTDKRLWIIEMNGKPHKSIYASLKGYAFRRRIYRRPMEYAAYLARPEPAASNPEMPGPEALEPEARHPSEADPPAFGAEPNERRFHQANDAESRTPDSTPFHPAVHPPRHAESGTPGSTPFHPAVYPTRHTRSRIPGATPFHPAVHPARHARSSPPESTPLDPALHLSKPAGAPE